MPNPRINRAQIPAKQPDPFGLATTRNFDGGSYASFAEVTPDVYRITPINHWDGNWAWWAVRSGQWAGRTPHFLIAKANHFGTPDSGEWLACWSTSPDTDTWNLFDNVSIGASDIEFYHNTAFPASGIVYIAAMPMYPFSRTQRLVATWAKDALVSSPTSATNLVVGRQMGRSSADGTGRIVPGLPYYGLKLANATANTKNTCILTSGNHPNESIGRFMLEGAVEWLRTTSVKQTFLLDWFSFYIYPALNPQGIYGGYFRSDPQNPTQDHNRLWDGTGVDEAVDTLKAAWNTDFSNVIEVGLDYHSWMAADGNKAEAIDSTTALWVAFIAKMQALDATFVMRADDATAGKLSVYWNGLTTQMCGFIDHGGVTTLGPADWKLVGQRNMIALANMLADGRFTNNPGVGSRDFNGTTDRIDWANVNNLKGDALTISAWVYCDAVAHNSYLLCQHDSGDTHYGIIFNISGDTSVNFIRYGTSDYNWGAANLDVDFDTPSAWHHVLVTSDGGLISGSVAIYVDGISKTVTLTGNGGTETEHTGSWSIGGRIYDDARNLDGHIAQVAVWDHVLDSTEIANLAAGYAPNLAEATGLLFYFKGNTESLTAAPGGDGTADGTTSVTGVGNGPAIIYG